VGGGAAAALYWRKLKNDAMQELEQRLNTLQNSYHQAMIDLTNRERSRLIQYGQQILSPVFSQLTVLRDQYEAQKKALQDKAEQSRKLRQEIDAIQIITD
jgi:protein subunit release factor B